MQFLLNQNINITATTYSRGCAGNELFNLAGKDFSSRWQVLIKFVSL
jgi:hypothetical protein